MACDNSKERRDLLKLDPDIGNDNTISSCISVRFGEFHALLAADCTNLSWNEIVDQHCPSGVHFIKVSHHGSLNGSFVNNGDLYSFLGFCNERKAAAISGGYRANLPHEAVMTALSKQNLEIYCTGSRDNARIVPYAVDGLTSGYLKMLGDHAPKSQVIESEYSGHGNITVIANEIGIVDIATELSFTG